MIVQKALIGNPEFIIIVSLQRTANLFALNLDLYLRDKELECSHVSIASIVTLTISNAPRITPQISVEYLPAHSQYSFNSMQSNLSCKKPYLAILFWKLNKIHKRLSSRIRLNSLPSALQLVTWAVMPRNILKAVCSKEMNKRRRKRELAIPGLWWRPLSFILPRWLHVTLDFAKKLLMTRTPML